MAGDNGQHVVHRNSKNNIWYRDGFGTGAHAEWKGFNGTPTWIDINSEGHLWSVKDDTSLQYKDSWSANGGWKASATFSGMSFDCVSSNANNFFATNADGMLMLYEKSKYD